MRHSRLHVTAHGGTEYRKSGWADGLAPLEDQLPQILQEVELRAGFAEEQRLAAEREQQERKLPWHTAMAEAKRRLRESHRAETLVNQADDWTRAAQLDRYLAAMETSIDAMQSADERAAAQQWLDWARNYRRQPDPLGQPLAMPDDPKSTAENLKPYLGRWSFLRATRRFLIVRSKATGEAVADRLIDVSSSAVNGRSAFASCGRLATAPQGGRAPLYEGCRVLLALSPR
jgi:hypothetical protein